MHSSARLRGPMVAIVLATALGLSAPVPGAGSDFLTSSQPPRTRFPLISWSWLRAPFAWLVSAPEPECTEGLCRELEGADGWQHIGFEVRDKGHGVYLDIQGRMQLRTAEVVFEGGELSRYDLAYARRDNGIFELKDFGVERNVLSVRMLVRSVSDRSTVTVRMGRIGIDVE